MRNKKLGFTLIELLAVIVILAIIALIAVPQILGVIEKSRKGAAEVSALGYVEAVEKYMIMHDMDPSKYPYDLKNNIWDVANSTNVAFLDLFVEKVDAESTVPALNTFIEVKGTKPTSGTVTVGSNNQVTSASLVINGYDVTCTGQECSASGNSTSTPSTVTPESTTTPEPTPTVTFGGTKVAAQAGETHKGIVYMDPTNISATCNQENSVSTAGTKTGCMKFYIYDDDGDTYKMILDHNTTALVAYETSGTYKEYTQASIKTTVDADTTGWVGSPRLITAEEIKSITGNTTFNGSSNTWFYLDSNNQTQTATTQGASNYAWLYDYTNGCTSDGCNIADSSTYGYWTSSPVSDNSSYIWRVSRHGYVDYIGVALGDNCGVRPVITILKSEFSS